MRKRQTKRRKVREESPSKKEKPPDVIPMHWSERLDEEIQQLEIEKIKFLRFKHFNPEKAMNIAHKMRKLNEERKAYYWSLNKASNEIENEIEQVKKDIERLQLHESEFFVRKIIALKHARIDGLIRVLKNERKRRFF